MDWQATVLWPALRPLFIQLIRTPLGERDADAIRRGERHCLAALVILDRRLKERTFLAGDNFTMGDIPAAVAVHRWYALDVEHPLLPNLQGWYQRMQKRRSFSTHVMGPLS
jgi:glutathione S-transferase